MLNNCEYFVSNPPKTTNNSELQLLFPILHTFPKSTNITSDRQNRKTHTKVQRITAKPNNRKKRIRTKHFQSLVSYR